ncbi:MAG: class I SAM-dependent methyltransferase [Chitinophagaceae bacterium]
MKGNNEREAGLQRLTLQNISAANQHYIVTYFIAEDIKSAASAFAKGKLLDIGCGNKPYFSFFKELVTGYTGCDIIQSSDNVVDLLCPADDLRFENDYFDTVFSTQVIEHVANHQEMLKEACRVLKKDGFAIFTAPFCWELHEEPYDFFRFTKYGLADIFEKNGLEIIKIKSNGGKWAALFQIALNTLYSTRRFNTFRSRLIKLLFIRLKFVVLYNKFVIWLDKRFFDDILTLNYIIVAKKK